MKPLSYHIIASCAAVLLSAACDKVCDIPGGDVAGDGNSIILDLSSGPQPASRAVKATDTETKVDHIDVLIFGEDGAKEHHERVSVNATGSGSIALRAKRSEFGANAKYWVYLIANSTADESVFAADDFDRDALRKLTQEDPTIHMTGYPDPGATNIPQFFLMDGIAYPEGDKEPELSAAAPVVLNDGDKSNDTRLKVTLRRAAAKLVIKINKGQFVEFHDASNACYYLRNMPYSTSVVTGVNAEAALCTPGKNSGEYFKWTPKGGPYTLITVTAYAYAHTWENESALEKETRLIVNIPMHAILHDKDGNYVDENGNVVTDPVKELHTDSYYQIPVCRGTTLERNTCYEVSLTLNVPGGTNPSKPVVLEQIEYEVRPWNEKTIDIGGESDRPAYLYVNEEKLEMHNTDQDLTTLRFSSSSEVTATITKVYYIDKFGQEQALTNISGDEWGVKSGNDWTNRCTLRITPDKGINGAIGVFGDVPENNAVRYIEFTVTNETGQSRSVTVAQYPLEYITNIQGWYSYRSDFGGTTFENKGDRTTSNNYFKSKVAEEITSGNNKGKSNIYRYAWRIYSQTVDAKAEDIYSPGNARMYHIVISATSKEYTLGIPRLDAQGYTESSAANNKLVSPSFMLASQLGALNGTFSNIGPAQTHCQQYVEVYKDKDGNKVVLDDWRLPTRAELEIIIKYQYSSDAMDEVIRRQGYWCADGGQVTNSQGLQGTGYLRCVRDAYDDKKTGN